MIVEIVKKFCYTISTIITFHLSVEKCLLSNRNESSTCPCSIEARKGVDDRKIFKRRGSNRESKTEKKYQ